MCTTEANGGNNLTPIPSEATLRLIRFVQKAGSGQEVLLNFNDPIGQMAVSILPGLDSMAKTLNTAPGDGIDVLTLAEQAHDHLGRNDELLQWVADATVPGTAPPIAITLHGARVIWSPRRAAILAAPERVEPFLLALVDFCYHEKELRKLESEVGENWPLLEMDAPLAYSVAKLDPERFENIGLRMDQTLKRRIRLARIAPRLYQPRPHLSLLANQLLDRLREKAHIEDRLEALDAQLEVFVRIYEMNSQRISDFKNSRQERTLEWVIIVLLATETLLLLLDVLHHLGH
jgi:hypothetical protein